MMQDLYLALPCLSHSMHISLDLRNLIPSITSAESGPRGFGFSWWRWRVLLCSLSRLCCCGRCLLHDWRRTWGFVCRKYSRRFASMSFPWKYWLGSGARSFPFGHLVVHIFGWFRVLFRWCEKLRFLREIILLVGEVCCFGLRLCWGWCPDNC
jgi:hypothetical protein